MSYVNQAVEGMAVTWRNKDLDQPLSAHEVEYFSNLAAQTPTKQSNKYFNLFAITNQSLIKKIFYNTKVPLSTTGNRMKQYANSQVISPLLLAWVSCYLEVGQTSREYIDLMNDEDIIIDTHQAVGISAGVVSYEANQKGFVTGYCRCFQGDKIKNDLRDEGYEIGSGERILLLLGIGKQKFGDPRRHQFYDMSYQPHDRIDPDIYYIK
jgi:hypothetical protein